MTQTKINNIQARTILDLVENCGWEWAIINYEGKVVVKASVLLPLVGAAEISYHEHNGHYQVTLPPGGLLCEGNCNDTDVSSVVAAAIAKMKEVLNRDSGA